MSAVTKPIDMSNEGGALDANLANSDSPKVTNATTSVDSCKDWYKLSQWIHCFCAVTFDLNLGQALECVYPKQCIPTEQEINNICYMAFPDSNSGCMGDTKFHMRLRCSENSNTHRFHVYNSECAPSLRVDQSHYWGFVYFRQKRDSNIPRGYFQKSFIIITRLPFFNLFYNLIAQLGPKYFNEGNAVLEAACIQINSQWPALQAGLKLNLPLFDSTYEFAILKSTSRRQHPSQLTVEVPKKTATSQSNSHENKDSVVVAVRTTHIIASVNELELFHSLCFVVENLYTLWELVLTAEPIVVVGSSPTDCSYMVQTLLALIAPLEYCAEARPYFTIHDSEFKEFTQDYTGRAPPAVILGVTNPFFVKLFKDWPHMLRLVDHQVNMQQQFFQNNLRNNTNSVTSFSSGGRANAPLKYNHSTGATSSMTMSINVGIVRGDNSMSGLHSKYKPFLKKDKALIKKVLLGMKTKRPEHVQTALLRRHLLELTHSFMIPLERYIASLMPLQKDISPFKSAPSANSFKLDDFLATLELSGPHLTSALKGDWKGLYRRFFRSPNFRGWYESRYRELQLTLQDLQLQALSQENLEHWARDKQEVEIIDMILKLKQKLILYTNKSRNEGGLAWSNRVVYTCVQIRAQIDCMKQLLPYDLKNVVNI